MSSAVVSSAAASSATPTDVTLSMTTSFEVAFLSSSSALASTMGGCAPVLEAAPCNCSVLSSLTTNGTSLGSAMLLSNSISCSESAVSSTAFVLQGPNPCATHSSENGATTTAPSLTNTVIRVAVVVTTKSVPRTPIAAIGVLSLNRCLAAFAAFPDTARAVPSNKLNFMEDFSGFSALNT